MSRMCPKRVAPPYLDARLLCMLICTNKVSGVDPERCITKKISEADLYTRTF